MSKAGSMFASMKRDLGKNSDQSPRESPHGHCATCVFCEKASARSGHILCHRYPTVNEVLSDYWCGEHRTERPKS